MNIEIDWAYALNALVWSAFGLTVGVFIGRFERIYLLGRSGRPATQEGTVMTTPERLRRRQYIEGALLVVIGILMLVQSAYFHKVDQDQREVDVEQQQCLADNFQDLSVALDARSKLTSRETSQNKALWLIYAEAAGLLKDDPTGKLSKKDQNQLQIDLVHQLLEYRREITDIEKDRKAHPLPPYPVGQCNDEGN